MFLQMSFDEFKKAFPELYADLKNELEASFIDELEHDKKYVIRLDPCKKCVEFGYLSDKWSVA